MFSGPRRTKAPCKTDSLWKTLRALNRPGWARTSWHSPTTGRLLPASQIGCGRHCTSLVWNHESEHVSEVLVNLLVGLFGKSFTT